MDSFVRSKFFTVLSIILLGFLVFLIFKSKPVVESLNKEINDLGNRIVEAQRKTENLQSEFEYFESDSYLEKQARLKLNLKNPGENVVYIVRDEEKVASESENPEEKNLLNDLIDKIFKRD